MPGAEVLVPDGRLAPDADVDGRRLQRQPLPAVLVAAACHVHLLEVEVLHVEARVGQPPRQPRVVPDDDKRRGGQRDPGHVQARRHQVRLVPDRGHLDGQVRVVGKHRAAGRRPRGRQDPAVAGAGARADVEPFQARRQRLDARLPVERAAAGGFGRGGSRGFRQRPRTTGRAARLEDGGRACRPGAHEPCRHGSADCPGHPPAHQLAHAVFGQPPREHPAHGQRVHRRPWLRREAQGQKLGRPAEPAHAGDGRVHPGAVLLERPAHQGRGRVPLLLRRPTEAQGHHPLVDPQRRRPEHLRQPAARRAAVQLHLPEPLARVEVAQRQPGILGVARVNMGHVVGVKEDLDGRRQPGQPYLPLEPRHGPAKAPPAERHKPGEGQGRQNQQQRHPPARPPRARTGHDGRQRPLAGRKTVRIGLGVGVIPPARAVQPAAGAKGLEVTTSAADVWSVGAGFRHQMEHTL